MWRTCKTLLVITFIGLMDKSALHFFYGSRFKENLNSNCLGDFNVNCKCMLRHKFTQKRHSGQVLYTRQAIKFKISKITMQKYSIPLNMLKIPLYALGNFIYIHLWASKNVNKAINCQCFITKFVCPIDNFSIKNYWLILWSISNRHRHDRCIFVVILWNAIVLNDWLGETSGISCIGIYHCLPFCVRNRVAAFFLVNYRTKRLNMHIRHIKNKTQHPT